MLTHSLAEFFDCIEAGDDEFNLYDESVPVTKLCPPPAVIPAPQIQPPPQIPPDPLPPLIKQLQSNAQSISSKLEKIEKLQSTKVVAAQPKSKFLFLLSWPIFLILLYRFFFKRR